MASYVMAIDQGTTSSRAMLFDANFKLVASAQQEFTQHYPNPGWVEHDPEEIWQTVLDSARGAMQKAGAGVTDIVAIGITNQRETTLVWDRASGKPVYNAIVWQDRRTAQSCEALKSTGDEAQVTEKTGLLLDPYFSATKIAWILDHVEGVRDRAERGELAFGTIDTFLIWRLTGGQVHATDATNASRTLLYNIREGAWDQSLLALFGVPEALLPQVRDCAADYGHTIPTLLGGPVAIRGVAGDQQAAAVGQACFSPGMIKSTYGTGCFALLNTGCEAVASKNRMLTTIACQLEGAVTYALEGSIFMAGAAVQWLRDELGVIEHASEAGALAKASDPDQEVYLVPAFVGLGAPYWDAQARGAIYGLTRGSGRRELARATLESVGFQTRDLLSAMRADWPEGEQSRVLRVDGGMVASDWTLQFLADILDAPVDRPQILETTALGAAWLAGVQTGFYPEKEIFAQRWQLERRFLPDMHEDIRGRKYAGWKAAVARTLSK